MAQTDMTTIYHITRREDWRRALDDGTYRAQSLLSEGFIHCSSRDQIVDTANRLFHGQRDLVLLCIRTDRITHPVRYENLEGGAEQYPHVYGPLDPDAVFQVLVLEPDGDGTFAPIDDALFPAPPPGYCPATRFRYPKFKLQIAAVAVLMILAPLMLALIDILHPPANLIVFGGTSTTADIVLVLATVLTTTIVHEWIHGAAYRLQGYRVTYGMSLRLLAAYAAAFGQWQTRNHNLVAALAPLAILTPAFIPLLAIRNHYVVLTALGTLLMNTAGAVGDIYLAARLVRLPRTTLLYDVDAETMLIYEPDTGHNSGVSRKPGDNL